MIRSYGVSRTGLVRKTNEDCIYTDVSPLYILADGMGGYKGGQTASSIAVQTAARYFAPLRAGEVSEETVRQSVLAANRAVLHQKNRHREWSQMGTTMIAAAVRGHFLIWGHVGDSRIYIFQEQKLRQITTDHSFVMNLLAEGKITEQEMREHPRKNEITRAVGIGSAPEVDTGTENLDARAFVLICSDGLSTMIDDRRILEILSAPGLNLEERVDAMIRDVYTAGATDNVSAILIEYNENESVK